MCIKNCGKFVPLIKKQKKTIMKKRVLLLAALFAGTASFAQVTSLKNKKGWEILPIIGMAPFEWRYEALAGGVQLKRDFLILVVQAGIQCLCQFELGDGTVGG